MICKLMDEILEGLQERLGDKAEVEIKEIYKADGLHHKLVIRAEGEKAGPAVDIDKVVAKAIRLGKEAVIEELAELYEEDKHERPKELSNLEWLEDWERAKCRLFFKAADMDKVCGFVGSVAHKAVCDIALISHVLINTDEGGTANVMVNEKLAEMWGVSFEDIIRATENSEAVKTRINSLYEEMKQMMAEVEGADLFPDNGMLIVTNDFSSWGASQIFAPGVMEEIYKKLQCNFWILPSSVREVLVLPDTGSQTASELGDMVRSVNQTDVAPEDKLSDSVYYYDGERKIFDIALQEE